MGKFIIRQTTTGLKFDLRAGNGENIATSEVYNTMAACHWGIESIRRNSSTEKLLDLTDSTTKKVTNPRYELFLDRSGLYRFRLRARNGEIILFSEGYRTKAGCESGIHSVRENAPGGMVEEENNSCTQASACGTMEKTVRKGKSS